VARFQAQIRFDLTRIKFIQFCFQALCHCEFLNYARTMRIIFTLNFFCFSCSE
jgi:hypothetical protein